MRVIGYLDSYLNLKKTGKTEKKSTKEHTKKKTKKTFNRKP